jgi:transcriptional regulator with XRE-family HTH domain
MKFRDWRLGCKLTRAACARALGIEGRNPSRTMQRIETGETRADAPIVEKIRALTGGMVTAEDMHQQRLAWLTEEVDAPEAAE